MIIEVSKEEKELVKKALKEYEENHYEMEGYAWQRRINKLIDKVEERF